jgi:hypothetical protein
MESRSLGWRRQAGPSLADGPGSSIRGVLDGDPTAIDRDE